MKSGKDNWEKACLLHTNINQGSLSQHSHAFSERALRSRLQKWYNIIDHERKKLLMYFFKGLVKQLEKGIEEPKGPKQTQKRSTKTTPRQGKHNQLDKGIEGPKGPKQTQKGLQRQPQGIENIISQTKEQKSLKGRNRHKKGLQRQPQGRENIISQTKEQKSLKGQNRHKTTKTTTAQKT